MPLARCGGGGLLLLLWASSAQITLLFGAFRLVETDYQADDWPVPWLLLIFVPLALALTFERPELLRRGLFCAF